MSRRSPRHWDGRDVRGSRTVKVVCSGIEHPHKPRLVGELGWKRDDVNLQDPRWTPAGPVLLGGTGQLAADGSALLSCTTPCSERVFLQPFELSDLVQSLIADGVSLLRLQDVAGKMTSQ